MFAAQRAKSVTAPPPPPSASESKCANQPNANEPVGKGFSDRLIDFLTQVNETVKPIAALSAASEVK